MDNDLKDKAIYDQNCQWYRYQDALMWGRFQTMAAIEGGMLYGLYQIKLPPFERHTLAIFASILVAIISRLAMIDGHYASGHLARIKEFEGYSLKPPKGPKGGILMRLAIGILSVFNVGLIARTFVDAS